MKGLCGLFRIRQPTAPPSSKDLRQVLLWSRFVASVLKGFFVQGNEISDIVKEMEALPQTSKLRQVLPRSFAL
jgi:hypothetical protein